MILVLSFLFKGETFSFVRGLWLLDLDNRKLFLWNSWISFASGVFRWWLEILLLPSIREIVTRSIFFGGIFVLSTGGRHQLGRFCRGSSTRLYQGVFISVIVIYDFFLPFFCSILFFPHDTANLIWLTFVVQERGHIDFLEQNVGNRTCSKLLKLIGIAGIIIIKASTRFSK